MTKPQFQATERDLLHKLSLITETLTALNEGRGTSFEVAAWNEFKSECRTLNEELSNLKSEFAFSQSTGIK